MHNKAMGPDCFWPGRVAIGGEGGISRTGSRSSLADAVDAGCGRLICRWRPPPFALQIARADKIIGVIRRNQPSGPKASPEPDEAGTARN